MMRLLLLTVLALWLNQTFAVHVTCSSDGQYATPGAATVDGDPVEWDTSIPGPDFFDHLYLDGDNSKTILVNVFMRRDCVQSAFAPDPTMYLLAIPVSGHSLHASPDLRWAVSVAGSHAVDGTFPPSESIGVSNPFGSYDLWEARFPAPEGEHAFKVELPVIPFPHISHVRPSYAMTEQGKDHYNLCVACDRDSDGDTVPDHEDADPNDPHVCQDKDGDGCDDCSILGVPDEWMDGPDLDGDGLCDSGDPDIDGDTVPNEDDTDPRNPRICRDDDYDGCDDCSQEGFPSPANDGEDYDHDGLCNEGDPDDDNDGVPDELDPEPCNPHICGDSDGDTCDDCIVMRHFAPDADGLDTDGDGLCDAGDPDDDNDGVPDEDDPAPCNPHICNDSDGDRCQDCAVGTDGFGPLPDNKPWDDGPDLDRDGLCDAGDPDDDNDGVIDEEDVDPRDPYRCRDLDLDKCDDCSVGVDGFGPLPDCDTMNDGPDDDHDGICNIRAEELRDCGDNEDRGVMGKGDGCPDCAIVEDGTGDMFNDGVDTDGDGLCDAGDKSLRGYVWLDLDADATVSPGDAPISKVPGAQVGVYLPDNTPVAIVDVNPDGTWSVDDLTPTPFIVRALIPSEELYVRTTPTAQYIEIAGSAPGLLNFGYVTRDCTVEVCYVGEQSELFANIVNTGRVTDYHMHVKIKNTESAIPKTLIALTDSVDGDVTVLPNSCCILPQIIALGESYSCGFNLLAFPLGPRTPDSEMRTVLATFAGSSDFAVDTEIISLS